MDSEYSMGSTQSDFSLPEENPTLKDALSTTPASSTAPVFLGMKPPEPTLQPLNTEGRDAHNHSLVSFREGRRASDTSLTQGQDDLCSLAHIIFHFAFHPSPFSQTLYQRAGTLHFCLRNYFGHQDSIYGQQDI